VKETLFHVWTPACVLLLLCACAAQKPLPPSAVPVTPAKAATLLAREKLALAAEKSGDLADALVHWKILRTIDPKNAAYRTRIGELNDRIRVEADRRIDAGTVAISKGDSQTARREFLAALALDPGNGDALAKLRRLEYDRVWQIQSAKLDKLKTQEEQEAETASEQERFYFELATAMLRQGDYAGAIREIQKYLNSYPNDRQAKKLAADAYAKLAAQQREQGQLRNALQNVEQAKRFNGGSDAARDNTEQELKKDLADEYYEKGLRVHRSDPSQAVEMYQKALSYNPDHTKAKLKLNEALRMLKTLQQMGK
jgi:tetratricopeptide (TPR) repeat protein